MAKYRVSLLFAAFAALLFAAACTDNAQGAKQQGGAPPATPVKVQVAQLQPVGEFTEYLATLRSRSSAVIKPQVEGYVTRIFVEAGAHVTPGQPLLGIDPQKQQATVNSQEATRRSKLANLEYNRREFERRKRLAEEGVISRQELDQARTAYEASVAEVEALEASVREQQVQLRYYTVKAPAAGTIGDIPVRVGDRVATDTILTTLDKGGELEAYIYVPAEKSASVRVGLPVELLDDQGKPVARTKVSFVSPRVDPQTQLLLVKADVPNGDRRFRNDQLVHARVVWKQADRPVIPVTAVARITGQTFAFVAEQNGNQSVAKQRSVQLGEVVGNDYVVLDGIKAGDKIITTGVQTLADGMPVQPQT